MMGMISLSTNWRAVWRTSFSSSLSWESKSMKSTPGKEGMNNPSSGKRRDAGSVARRFRERQENEGMAAERVHWSGTGKDKWRGETSGEESRSGDSDF